MPIEFVRARLISARVLNVSSHPREGILTLETTEGRQRMQIDEQSASTLLDEILIFFGVPRID